MSEEQKSGFTCPLPLSTGRSIRLGHGSGGQLSSDLIENVFVKHVAPEHKTPLEDAAIVGIGSERIAITTDSYVVNPVVFPGGNIGSLAAHGTINDLCVRGAKPSYISAGFILEEGLSIELLELAVESFASACRENDVQFVCGDTKVVNKGAGDQIFINTTGIGELLTDRPPSSAAAQVGDKIIVSGEIGLHGTAIMCARSGLGIEADIASDSASLLPLVREIYSSVEEVHCMRDITRGGLATVLNELASASQAGFAVDERLIPVGGSVQSVCELLGLDPLYVACEGRLVAIVPEHAAEAVLTAMHTQPLGAKACIIGEVVQDNPGTVICRSLIGGRRYLDKLSGEQLPRIC